MFRALSALRCASIVLGCLGGLLLGRQAPAQSIDISLNVFYANPGNVNSGGTWELVAKSSHSGISGLSVLLSNITTAQRVGPIGTVNGTDPAGFSQFFNTLNPLGFRNITVGQAPIPPGGLSSGEEQSVFYGVGTLANGAPNYAAKPPGTNSIGPAFTSLTVPAAGSGIPWAVADAFNSPAWSTAARLAGGEFPAGVTPGFFQNAQHSSTGNVFTTVGSSTNYGAIAQATLTTIVRTNFMSGGVELPDYNGNGTVDAADYVLWRNTLGQNGPGLPADGNNDNMITLADYDLWRAHFGAVVPGPASASSLANATSGNVVIPEPASAVLLAIGCVCLVRRSRHAA